MARMSRTPSTMVPQSRPGLRAIRISSCRRDCRTRRSITGSLRLSVPFIGPDSCPTRMSRMTEIKANLDWTSTLLVCHAFEPSQTNLSPPRTLYTSATMTQGTGAKVPSTVKEGESRPTLSSTVQIKTYNLYSCSSSLSNS